MKRQISETVKQRVIAMQRESDGSLIINTFNMKTEDERSRLLYRPEMTRDERERIRSCLFRLFNNPIWILQK